MIEQARAEGKAEADAAWTAKVVALADLPTPGPSLMCMSPKDRDDQWRTAIRALIPADPTALDEVRAQAKAEERERIVRALEEVAKRFGEKGYELSRDPYELKGAQEMFAAKCFYDAARLADGGDER